jgi:hypothetical protein
MAFIPDPPFEKLKGDLIRSKDWNDAIHEIQRLDTAKVNRTNDVIPGPLTISGTLNFGSQVRQMINLWSNIYGIGVQGWTQYYRTDKNFAWYKGGSHNDAELNPGGGTVQMVINDGKIGIGTSTPNRSLTISNSSGANYMNVRDGAREILMGVDSSGGIVSVMSDDDLVLRAGGNIEKMRITKDGTIRIGSGSDFGSIAISSDPYGLMILGRPTLFGRVVHIRDFLTVNYLTVNNEAFKPGGGSWAVPSDISLKTNVGQLEGALEKLLQLRGVTFEWKEPEKHGGLRGPQMGMVAQEVEKVFPEWVGQTPDGLKFLSIRGFEALVVEALRSLEARVKALETSMRKEKPDA